MDLDSETQWVVDSSDLGRNFARGSRKLCDENACKYAAPLDFILKSMMTELWDFGFSQTEIRNAFAAAVEDMPRYAAGAERR